MKGVKRFGVKDKLIPYFIGPFPILERCGHVAYKLDLLLLLVGVHNVFHILQLKKCLKTPLDVVLPDVMSFEANMSYLEHLIKLLDQKDRVTRRQTPTFTKCSGPIIQKEKLCGKARSFSIPTIRTFYPHMKVC
jgi:hypothetical protein